MSLALPKSHRLLSRQDFSRFRHTKRRFYGFYLSIQLLPTKKHHCRLGLAVSKRFGNAVRRNRFKRLAREAFRLHKHRFTCSFDLLVRPKTAVKGTNEEIPFSAIEQDLLQLASEIGAYHVPPRAK